MANKLTERRMSERSFAPHYAGAILATVLLGAGLMMSSMPVLVPLALVPIAGVFAWSRLARAGTVYRLFGDRLEIESGILNRKIENIELFRIRDVGLRQGLVGRMSDFGDVYVHSTDSSTPDMHLRGIDQPREFYEQLRELVSASRAQTRTMILEEGATIPEN